MTEKETSNVNIAGERVIATPRQLKSLLPLPSEVESLVLSSREQLRSILAGRDKRIFIQKENLIGCKTDKDYYEVAKNMVENWKIAHNLVKSYNGQFIAILEPNIYYTDTKIHHSIKIIESDTQVTKKIYSLVSRMANELNYFYDYKSLYNGSNTDFFTITIHPRISASHVL